MPRSSAERRLQWLAELRVADLDPQAIETLRACFAGSNSAVAAAAARCAGRCGTEELVPTMADAFQRFVDRPEQDRACLAKTAIVHALEQLDRREPALLLRGARHVQMEAAYGGPVDTAAELRTLCGLELVRIGHHEAAYVLVDLLHDHEPGPRRTAAKALGFLGTREGELLLRAKVRAGDAEPAVFGECFAALMAIAPDRSLEFVHEFLDDADPAVADEAALAIGESRHPEAFAILRERYRAGVRAENRVRLLLPIALTRHEKAFAFLLAVLKEAGMRDALSALEALGVYDDHGERREKIRRATQARAVRELAARFRQLFA